MSKQENITAARENWENRKIGRPVQEWAVSLGGVKAAPKGAKGAIPKHLT